MTASRTRRVSVPGAAGPPSLSPSLTPRSPPATGLPALSAVLLSPPLTSLPELLEEFDRNVANARAAIAGASDEHLRKPWSLLAGGKTIFTLPRVAVLRSMVLNHMIHHRAQLGVYLRLNDIPVPATYGPSADESSM